MSEQDKNTFDPFAQDGQESQNPGGYAPGYGGFGNTPPPQNGEQSYQNGPQQDPKQEGFQGGQQPKGGFYGPDFFSGGNHTYGGNQGYTPQGGGFFGQGQTPPPPPPPSGKGPGHGFGIASLVCGIVSLVCCCCSPFLPLACAIAAIILSIVQYKKDKQMSGMSIGGLVTGIIGCIIGFCTLIFITSDAFDAFMEEYEKALNEAMQDAQNENKYEDDLFPNDPNGMIDVTYSENEF